MEGERTASAETRLKVHNGYSDVVIDIRCIKSTFSLQVKDDVKPYQMWPRQVEYALQTSFKKELERPQDHLILAPL